MYGWTHELVALLANYGSILYIVAFLPMVWLLYCTLYCNILYCTGLAAGVLRQARHDRHQRLHGARHPAQVPNTARWSSSM